MIGECALCRERRPLLQSHIVPEFLHRPIYDERHRTLSFAYGDPRADILQKGVRERLLCAKCEARIQKWEHYFANFWYGSGHLPDPLPADGLVLEGVDYAKLKLFVLSIVWRASAARSDTFRAVTLGPHHERVRSMLLDEQPGHAMTYRIYAGLIRDPESGSLWDEILLMPLRIKVLGLWAYRCVFGGASWTMLVSAHKSAPMDALCLCEEGRLPLTCVSWPDFAKAAGLPEAIRNLPR